MMLAAVAALIFAPTPRDLEQCYAWTVGATGVDPVAEATAPAPQPPALPPESESERMVRFSRGYAACLQSRSDVDAAEPPSVALVVGRPVPFRPPALPASVICDDLSVVRVEDAGTFLRLTGLKPGETSCSFGSAQQAGRRALYRIRVQSP